jgi:branched-chain amino acid transport system substrate-binding protein
VRGWASATVWVEALRRADKAGKLTGEGVKAALETFKDFDLGGLTSPVTWTGTDHRPSTTTAVFMVKDGKLVKVKDYTFTRKAEWLGL